MISLRLLDYVTPEWIRLGAPRSIVPRPMVAPREAVTDRELHIAAARLREGLALRRSADERRAWLQEAVDLDRSASKRLARSPDPLLAPMLQCADAFEKLAHLKLVQLHVELDELRILRRYDSHSRMYPRVRSRAMEILNRRAADRAFEASAEMKAYRFYKLQRQRYEALPPAATRHLSK